MTSRRDFIKYTVVLGAGLFLTAKLKPSGTAHAQSGPGHSHHGGIRRIATNPALQALVLDPATITKYATQLVIPPAMPKAAKPKGIKGPKNFDYYQISVQQFNQQILPAPFGSTTVWGYGSAAHPGTHNYPAFTIEATANKPARVQWINGLVDASGAYLPHLLPVDQTLHWANPPGGTAGRDGHSMDPTPYTGPVPMVTHVHGAHTTDESDGYAEAWYLPKANNIPAGYATEGTWYNTFKAQFLAEHGEAWPPGGATFEYPNNQRAATLWYHDHSLGMTRLNVYAGPAGFYLVRGGPGDAVRDSRTNTPAVLPGPAPKVGSSPFGTFFEIPIAIQDRSFKPDGQLFYPDNRAYFEGLDPSQLQIPFHPDDGVRRRDERRGADLESRVLRQLHRGQRPDVALPERPAAPVSPAHAQRVPGALPDPGLQRYPWGPGAPDRRRGRLPACAIRCDGRGQQPLADVPRGTRRPDRRLHQRPGRRLRARQPRPG